MDDGSGPGYREIFDRAEKTAGCIVLRHDKNRGKGRALKTGFAWILNRWKPGEERIGILCMDCDGQHLPEDGAILLEKARQQPGSLVLGVRDFSRAGVPWRSRIGNRISARILEMASGLKIQDTQTGLRAFDSSLLEFFCRVPGEGFDYETEMLLACGERKIPVVTENIHTVYQGKNKGSHFRPVRDSLKVLAIFLGRPGRFVLASLFSALADLLLFWLLEQGFRGLGKGETFSGIFTATLAARSLSGILNYLLNRRWVFGRRGKPFFGFWRYLFLWAGVMAASAALVTGVSALTGIPPEAAKIFCDGALFLLSYQIQKRWVFPAADKGGESHGGADG